MKILLEKTEGCLHAILAGELSIYAVNDVKAQLLSYLSQSDLLEVDLAQVTEIDSAGLQLLLLIKRESIQQQKSVQLTHHSHAVIDLIELYDLASYFGDPLFISTATQNASMTTETRSRL